jgi:hypothetical protein
MLSQLGSVFKTTFRHAESADTRQEIRREEKEDGHKKKDRDQSSRDDSALWDDSMAVSVEALHSFLVEFLKSHGAPLPAQESLSISPHAAPSSEQRQPVNSTAARAVKAYTAMTPAPTPQPISQTDDNNRNINPADLLSAEEIRTIHALIDDVDRLAKAGAQTLNIVIVGTFLESLVEAVRVTKEGAGSRQ